MGKAMVPASMIADLVCKKIGDNTGAKKMEILQYIALGYQHMKIFSNVDKSIVTKIIELDYATQFDLGCSFLYATKVGIRTAATDTCPPSKLKVLNVKDDLEVSVGCAGDEEKLEQIKSCLQEYEDEDGDCDCYFYNGPCGTIRGYGKGYSGNNYYNITDGVLNISPFLLKSGENLELVVEMVEDVLNTGLTLVPSEAFNCMMYYALSEYYNEGLYGKNRDRYEMEFKVLNRLYNFKSIDQLTKAIKG